MRKVIKFMNIHGFSTENSTSLSKTFLFHQSIHIRLSLSLFCIEQFFGVVFCHSLIDCSIIVLPSLSFNIFFLWNATSHPQRKKKKNTRIHFILICHLRFFSNRYASSVCIYQINIHILSIYTSAILFSLSLGSN